MEELTLKERRNAILNLLHEKGKVKVSELSEKFNVSEVSIRNDLADLETEGKLSRVHGGAISAYDSYYNMSLAQRSNTNREAKEKIARKVSTIIFDTNSVMINAGTTAFAVAKKLAETRKNIKVVTNSIITALENTVSSNLHITLLGGEVNPEYQYVYGTLTLCELQDYYADVFIVSADGIDADGGLTTYYDQEVDICRKMIENSKKVIAVLDSTKLGKVTYKRIADCKDIDVLVTNKNADKKIVKELKSNGIEVVLA